MSVFTHSRIALFLILGFTLARNAGAGNIGTRIDARLPANRTSSKLASNRLAARAEDEREKDQELQTAAKKKEPDTPTAQRIRAISDEMREKKTRSVIAGQ